MDILVTVGPRLTEELRYCLRSIEANLPHGDIWMLGNVPTWATNAVRPCRTSQQKDAHTNVKSNLRWFLDDPATPDEFYLFNDDFFVMEPIKSVPAMHLGSLEGHVARLRAMSCSPHGAYVIALECTLAALRVAGHDDPLSYEAHVPMQMTKDGLSRTLDFIGHRVRLHERSVYAALHNLEGSYITDVKVWEPTHKIPDGPFLSTNNQSFARLAVGRHIRDRFPTPCRYERT